MEDAVIKVKVKEHDELLKEHGKRLDKIEQENAEFRIYIRNLCKKLDDLTNWIKKLILAILGALVGFVLWYIQTLHTLRG